jgi:hypothetical protein
VSVDKRVLCGCRECHICDILGISIPIKREVPEVRDAPTEPLPTTKKAAAQPTLFDGGMSERH